MIQLQTVLPYELAKFEFIIREKGLDVYAKKIILCNFKTYRLEIGTQTKQINSQNTKKFKDYRLVFFVITNPFKIPMNISMELCTWKITLNSLTQKQSRKKTKPGVNPIKICFLHFSDFCC